MGRWHRYEICFSCVYKRAVREGGRGGVRGRRPCRSREIGGKRALGCRWSTRGGLGGIRTWGGEVTVGWPARQSASWPCRKAKTASTANAACPAAYRPELAPSQLPWMLMTADEPRDRRLYYANKQDRNTARHTRARHSSTARPAPVPAQPSDARRQREPRRCILLHRERRAGNLKASR